MHFLSNFKEILMTFSNNIVQSEEKNISMKKS